MIATQRMDRDRGVLKKTLFIFATLVFVSGSIADDGVLIRAKHLLTMEGKTLEPGAVLVRDGKIAVVAEGIETTEQLTTLRDMGVDVGQGYLLSKPLSADRVAVLLSIEASALA